MLPSPSTGITSTTTPSAAANAALPAPLSVSVSAGTKRPAATDLQRGATPSKRQATSAAKVAATNLSSTPIIASSPPSALGYLPHTAAAAPPSQPQPVMSGSAPPVAVLSEDQLVGRSPEQLIATILQVQSQHQQYVSHLCAQYDSINQQLSDLRGGLAAFFSAQAASHQAAASHLTPREPPRQNIAPSPVATVPYGGPMPPAGPPRAPPAQPANRPSRPPPPSPSHPDARLLPKPAAAAPQTPGPPAYDYRTVGTVDEVWREYREGMDGQPAIEELDATWGSRWRPEPRGRTWYSRRKVIWDKIKDFIGDGMDEDDAVKEVEKLRDGGTINKLIRLLQDERKEKGLGDDSLLP